MVRPDCKSGAWRHGRFDPCHTHMDEPEPQERLSPLVDITELPFDQIPTQSSALAQSIEHILADVKAAAESISGWASAIE